MAQHAGETGSFNVSAGRALQGLFALHTAPRWWCLPVRSLAAVRTNGTVPGRVEWRFVDTCCKMLEMQPQSSSPPGSSRPPPTSHIWQEERQSLCANPGQVQDSVRCLHASRQRTQFSLELRHFNR